MSRFKFELAAKCIGASAMAALLTACGGSKISAPAGPGLSSISGSYVFQASGADGSDGDYSVLGSFVADGKGGITSAVADYNLGSGTDENVPLTGTYTVAGTTITFNLTDGGSVKDSFTTTIVTPGTSPIQNFDGSGSGTLYKQTTSGFTAPGTYSFSLAGEGEGVVSGSGQFVASANGTFSGGSLTYTDSQTSTAYATVTGYLAPPAASGRGYANLEGNNLAYYVVGPNQIQMMGLDSRALLIIPAQKM